MTEIDARKTLWDNLLALMVIRYGKENMGKLAKDAGIGGATMTRIKEQNTSVGTEHLDKLAKALKVPTWQLLCPGFDFKSGTNTSVQDVAPKAKSNRSGKDLQFLFDMIPDDSDKREPAYAACLRALLPAITPTASQPTADTPQVANQERRHA